MAQDTMTIEQLGEQFRSQNPEAFSAFSNEEIGKRAILRNPALMSRVVSSVDPQKKKDTNFLQDVVTGAKKGLLSTAKGASGLGERALTSTLQTILPQRAENALGLRNRPNLGIVGERTGGGTSAQQLQSTAEQNLGLKPGELTTPQNFGEKVGFTGEQIAEFFVPATAPLRIGKAVGQTAKAVGKAPNVVKGLRLGATVGSEAGIAGLQTAVQQGEIDSATITNAVLAGSFPLGGKLAGLASKPFRKYLSEKLPSKLINNVIRPSKNEFLFGRNPGKAVVDEGITANTREGLLKEINSRRIEIGRTTNKALQDVPKDVTVNIQPSLEPIDKAMNEAVSSGERALYNRLKDLKDGLTKEFIEVDGALKPVRDKNLILSPLDANKVKQKIGADTKWTGQAFDNDINKVRRQVYANINTAVDEAVGEIGETGTRIKDLNNRYANMLGAEKSLENRIQVAARNNLIGLPDLTIGGAVGVSSAVGGGDPVTNIARALGTVAVRKGFNSTAFRTRAAKLVQSLSPEEKSLFQKIAPVLEAIILESQTDNK